MDLPEKWIYQKMDLPENGFTRKLDLLEEMDSTKSLFDKAGCHREKHTSLLKRKSVARKTFSNDGSVAAPRHSA